MDQKDVVTIYASDYGLTANSGKCACSGFRRALDAVRSLPAEQHVVLYLEQGRYDFYEDGATKEVYYISNTASEAENPDPTKNIGVYLKELANITMEGNESLFILHGKITPFVVDSCQNIHINHLTIDYERPTMSEMTVEAVHPFSIDFDIHPDSWYQIERDQLIWIGEGWHYSSGPAQEYDPITQLVWRSWNPVTEALYVEELAPYKIRMHYAFQPETRVGRIFQMRDGIRDQVGTFLIHSREITLEKLHYAYMHGLGIVGQFSEHIYLNQLTCSPRTETGRTAAAFADFIHLSGCKGKIKVIDCMFRGSHDDVLNVHGTHLRIIRQLDELTCIVRFMHSQTYGFQALFPGDQIAFINRLTLTELGRGIVDTVVPLNSREIKVKFAQPVPQSVCLDDVIENISWVPDLEFRGNQLYTLPTRGVLITTRGKVEIEDNVFDGLQMSAILIADDCNNWYESGMVSDVTIRNNRFANCYHEPVIHIFPENEKAAKDLPVHQNIRIQSNEFELCETVWIKAKSTSGLTIEDNTVSGRGPNDHHLIVLQSCTEVQLSNNDLKMDGPLLCMTDSWPGTSYEYIHLGGGELARWKY